MAYLVICWIDALAAGKKVATYCSDVSGAFDKVSTQRLIAKLKAQKVHPDLLAVIASWLRQRTALVVSGGKFSNPLTLKDMLFQGTVWGPNLWNAFFKDASRAIKEHLFTEIVYADDLNAYKICESADSNETIKENINRCQSELHKWGRANQVAFDAGKESKHILSLTESEGKDFKILGVLFDCQLDMTAAVNDIVNSASWKIRTLLRTQRFYTTGELVVLYKSQLLSYIEYRTAAIYHALREILARLDNIQTKFLQDAGVTAEEALMEFNLAPLAMRRDIAMLGLIHRAALGKGPPQLRQLIKRRPGSCMIVDPYENVTRRPIIRRSMWGLVPVYNRLGSAAQSKQTVKDFQTGLQERVKRLLQAGHTDRWQCTYSPR